MRLLRPESRILLHHIILPWVWDPRIQRVATRLYRDAIDSCPIGKFSNADVYRHFSITLNSAPEW